jgi:hypothetical protein
MSQGVAARRGNLNTQEPTLPRWVDWVSIGEGVSQKGTRPIGAPSCLRNLGTGKIAEEKKALLTGAALRCCPITKVSVAELDETPLTHSLYELNQAKKAV